MKIECVSDLHGHYPKISEESDVIIVAGDITAQHKEDEFEVFFSWLNSFTNKYKILVAGNHDTFIEKNEVAISKMRGFYYLSDSYIVIDGVKFYGSPWTKKFKGMNVKCGAFTVEKDEELKEIWDLIPDDIDVLITHCPPGGILDFVAEKGCQGSASLRNQVTERIKPRLHIFGHVHECGGRIIDTTLTKFVNASIVNEKYDRVNEPVVVEIEDGLSNREIV